MQISIQASLKENLIYPIVNQIVTLYGWFFLVSDQLLLVSLKVMAALRKSVVEATPWPEIKGISIVHALVYLVIWPPDSKEM